MATFSANEATITNDWYLVDANGKTLGRLATEIARRLRGKHKPTYTSHVDTGDYIIVINTDKLQVTGNKAHDKIYYHSTSRPGSLKAIRFEDLMAKNPITVLEKAVKGMLPKGPLGRQMFKKLKAYVGAEHPHAAQTPKLLEIKEASK
jgi:large subunit ribosomal protein L13